MPEISLATLSLALGAIAFLGGIMGFMGGEKTRDFLNGFSRNTTAGYILILAATAWFLLILKDENLADFENLRTPFYVFILVTGIGSCLYLKDYLAVRGTAVLKLLLAKLIVDTARFHESDWRLVLVVAAYMMVIGGMWFTVSPWRMRDLLSWATADDKRFKTLCGARIAFGVILVGLGLFEFK